MLLPYFVAYGLMIVVGLMRFSNWEGESRNHRRYYCVFFALLWIILLGLRHPSMGGDLEYGDAYGYLGRFEFIGGLDWKEVLTGRIQNYERGYIIFNKLLSYLGVDPQILLFACAVVSISLIAGWIYRNSEYPLLSSVIYIALPCFYINFSGLRQGIAVSITLFALEMAKRKKLIWFILLVLLAMTFHGTAWVFLFAYPLYHMKMNKAVSVCSLLIPIFVYFFRYPLFQLLSKLFKENAALDDNGAITLFLVFWLVYLFAVLFGHEWDQEELGLRNLFLVACCCQAFGSVYNTAMRIGYYFMVSLVVLLPKIIVNTEHTMSGEVRRKSSLIMYLGMFLCFAAFGLYSLESGDSESWMNTNPYSFFWQ